VHDGAIIGSPATVAAKLNELTGVPGTGGIMLTFDDFLEGTEVFGRDVMPLLD
jgi:pyrimidine oxygenase